MNVLDEKQVKLCQLQGKIFEESYGKTECGSPIFIRRFMNSKVAESFDSGAYLYLSSSIENSIEEIELEYGKTKYGKVKYTKDELYWIGYIYRCISIRFSFSSKAVFRIIDGAEIKKYYNIGHTFDIIEAAERILELKGYKETNVIDRAYNSLKSQMELSNLVKHIDEKIEYVEKAANSDKTVLEEIVIKFKNDDKSRKHKAVLINLCDMENSKELKLIAIAHGTRDFKNTLIICENDKKFDNKTIKALIKERYENEKIKIIRN